MKKIHFSFLILLMVTLACTDKNKLPEGILAQPKMQAVMWDLLRAGDFLNNYVLFKDTAVDKIAESQKWNEKVFQIHKITREQFSKSYEYYRQHPQLMKVIMDSISKIKVEAAPVTPAAPAVVSLDTLKKKMDSIRSIRINSRLHRLKNKKLPSVE